MVVQTVRQPYYAPNVICFSSAQTAALPVDTLSKRIDRVMVNNPKVLGRLLSIHSTELSGDPVAFAKGKIRDWVGQFDTPGDQAIALKLLEKMTMVDEGDIRQNCRDLHRWLGEQRCFNLGRTRFTSIGNAKSGGIINYFYRQENNLSEKFFMSMPSLKHETPNHKFDTLVILDDMIGSGNDAFTHLRQYEDELKQYKRVYYLSMYGTQEGARFIQDNYPNVKVYSLHPQGKLFSAENQTFNASEKRDIRDFLERYADRAVPEMKDQMPTGYRDSQALMAFSYNTPSNTLPIFWSDHKGWKPLFPRYTFEKGRVHTPKFGSGGMMPRIPSGHIGHLSLLQARFPQIKAARHSFTG